MMAESDTTAEAIKRLNVKKQTLDDAYAAPANFLEIDVVNPVTTIGVGKKRFTDYEVKMRVSFKLCLSYLEYRYLCKVILAKKYSKRDRQHLINHRNSIGLKKNEMKLIQNIDVKRNECLKYKHYHKQIMLSVKCNNSLKLTGPLFVDMLSYNMFLNFSSYKYFHFPCLLS